MDGSVQNPNSRRIINCGGCGEKKEHHAKELCYSCYKRIWKGKNVVCKSCRRTRPHKAFGLCGGCHNRIHHYDKIKSYNVRKAYGISYELYKQISSSCVSCGFSKFVDLHHLDGDNKNNSSENLVGLCPNCHKMIHSYDYFLEIKEKLSVKGFDVEKIHPSNYVFRRDEKKSKKT